MEEDSPVVIDDIECPDEVLDVAFHPLRDAIAIVRKFRIVYSPSLFFFLAIYYQLLIGSN